MFSVMMRVFTVNEGCVVGGRTSQAVEAVSMSLFIPHAHSTL